MQAEIKIEPVPKLDKVLRVAFASVKRDIHNLRGEFDHLEDKVHSSLDVFQKKLDSTTKSTEREVRERTQALEKLSKQSHTQLEKEIASIAKSTEKFIKQTNEKIMDWNVKIRGVSKTEAIVKDMQIEIKHFHQLKNEFEKLDALQKHLHKLESSVIGKDEYEKELTSMKQLMEKTVDKLNINIQIAAEKQSSELVKQQKEIETKIFTVDERIDKVAASVAKIDKISQDKSLITKTKQLETIYDAHQKHIDGLKQALMDQQANAKAEHDEIRALISGSEKSALSQKDIDLRAASIENDQKAFADNVQKQLSTIQVEIKKALEQGAKGYQTELAKQKKDDLARMKELEKHIAKLEKGLEKCSNKKSAVVTKVKTIKEEKPKKEKKPKGPTLWRRFVDFLVEDIDEDKDSKLAEFDRKKGEKFEIKEITELK